jgi:hypothetical protein
MGAVHIDLSELGYERVYAAEEDARKQFEQGIDRKFVIKFIADKYNVAYNTAIMIAASAYTNSASNSVKNDPTD